MKVLPVLRTDVSARPDAAVPSRGAVLSGADLGGASYSSASRGGANRDGAAKTSAAKTSAAKSSAAEGGVDLSRANRDGAATSVVTLDRGAREPNALARHRAALPPTHLADLDLAGRRAVAAGMGEKEFRANQLSMHYFGRLVRDPTTMTDVPAADRRRLASALLPTLLTPVRELDCDNGTTRKTLWRLHDGSLVESVLMGYADRVTVCVSSQAGCGMACPFCATGQAGLTRNLSTAEIIDQVVWFAALAASGVLPDCPPRLSRVVFMGMGEPLANYSRVIDAVRRLAAPAPEGLGLSQRHITVSTVGLVPAIRRLISEDLSVTLALSLHAPDDDLRDELVPVNQHWKVAEVLDAAWSYAAHTGRRVSIEYAMIKDVNDQPWRADLLGQHLSGRLAHVNLIPLNPTPGSRWDASPKPVEREFVRRLRAAGVPTTVRDTRGREIDGACGQLAAAEVDG